MQPLYSVDHETRQSSSRAEEGGAAESGAAESEGTPLLARFPPADAERSPFMMIAVSLLLTVLVTGVIIGIYLLVLQNNSENILPPVETPLRLVARRQWAAPGDAGARAAPAAAQPASLCARRVGVTHTNTQPCHTTSSCTVLVQTLQSNASQILPYNFLVSSNGETYEALGWRRPSPLLPEKPYSLLLAFIGNYTATSPSQLQIDEAKNFFAESVSRQHLAANFTVFGKAISNNNETNKPTYLFSSLKNLPQWSNELTDW